MTPAFVAEFLARPNPIGPDMRGALVTGYQNMTAAEQAEVWCQWYALDPDGVEHAIHGMPGRDAFHDMLIAHFAHFKIGRHSR